MPWSWPLFRSETQKLPKYPFLPATRIGRLAVSVDFRGRRLGDLLLMDAWRRCIAASLQVASAAVIVDAKNDQAAAFYKRHGFLETLHPPKLYVTMEYVAGVLGAP